MLRMNHTETSQERNRCTPGPLQFAYRTHPGIEDAVLVLLHHLHQHLDRPNTYAQVLFVDFSSAFNTIQPHLMTQKLHHMNVSPKLVLWVHDFLTNRNQYVKIGNITYIVSTTSTGAPQGCVISLILFALYTSDCKPIRENRNYILVKYADDKCLTGLITNNIETARWCSVNYLEHNTKKTKENVVDFRKKNKHHHHSCCKMKMWSV